MKRNLFSTTTYPVWVSGLYVVIVLFNNFMGLIKNPPYPEIILGVLFLIALDIPQQVESRKALSKILTGDLHEKFEKIDELMEKHKEHFQDKLNQTGDLMKDHFGDITDLIKSDNIGVITEIEQTRVFRDFIGDVYYAYNSPMEYELEKIDERMDFHVKRYSNPNFKMAHYYYPILSSPDKKFVKEWMNGIYAFYKILNNDKRLTSEQKNKITFYVPKNDVIYSSNFEITYFIGKTLSAGRQEREEAVVYIHNNIFMELDARRPKVMFIIYRENLIGMLHQHKKATTGNMIPKYGIDEFLEYLNEKLDFGYE
jgi:hypothetical protein